MGLLGDALEEFLNLILIEGLKQPTYLLGPFFNPFPLFIGIDDFV